MSAFGRAVGVMTGVLAGAFASGAQAQSQEGVAVEFSAGSAEIETMSVDYGRFLPNQIGPGSPLIADSGGERGDRFELEVSNLWRGLFGWNGGGYLRGAYQNVDDALAASAPKAINDMVIVPTGQLDTPTTSSAWFLAATGSGTIAVSRDLDQDELEFAAGFAFDHTIAGFTPRVEIGYRRGDSDQVLTADRVGVTPMLEEFTTHDAELSSDCAEIAFGATRSFPLSQSWSVRVDGDVGLGICAHDLAGAFTETSFGTTATSSYADDSSDWTGRGALTLGLDWRLTPSLSLGLDAFVRGETGAPYIAFPGFTFDGSNNFLGLTGTDIRIDTEDRSAYGAALRLRFATN